MRCSSSVAFLFCMACVGPVASYDPPRGVGQPPSGRPGPELQVGPDAKSRPGVEGEEGDSGPLSYRSAEIEQIRVTTPHTIEAGEVEIALVPSHLDFGESAESEFLTEIEIGVLDALLLEIEVPFRSVDQEMAPAHGGLADVAFSLKYQLPRLQALDLQSAVGVELSLPSGDEDRGLGKGDPVLEAFLSLQRDFGRWTGVTDFFFEMQNNEKPQLEWNGAVLWRPGERPFFAMLGMNVELKEFESGGEPETSLVPGLEYQFDGLSIGLGVPIGLSHDAQDLGVILLFEFDL